MEVKAISKRGPKVRWTKKRVGVITKKIRVYAMESFQRTGEMKGLSFVGPELPTVADCLKKNRLNKSTVYGLASEYEELENALKKIKDAQEYLLVNYGLRGGYASTFAIFTAKNILGWRDEKPGPLVDQSNHTTFNVQIEKSDAENDLNQIQASRPTVSSIL